MQQMVEGFVSCLERRDARNAQQVSLATAPTLRQAAKVDIIELDDSHRKSFFAPLMDAAYILFS